MRWFCLVVAVALLHVASGPTAADDAPPPPTQNTKLVGAAPAGLRPGRWFLLAKLDLPGNHPPRAVPAFWDVSDANGLTLTVRLVKLPAAQQAKLDQGNTSGTTWEPTTDDLRAIDAEWDQLPVDPTAFESIETEIVSRDAFDDQTKADPDARDALFLVKQDERYAPSAAPAIKQANVYAALTAADGGFQGRFAGLTLAAAPFPIPIGFKGLFRAWALNALPTKGLLERLGDVFSGCRRR